MTKSGYRQLQAEERITLASLRQQGQSLRAIARTLNRSASSISRELQRNVGASGYVAGDAHAASAVRRKAARPWPKLHADLKLWRVVKTCLAWRWSPQQISRTLARMWPDEPDMQVSHETIYTAIYAHAANSSPACAKARAPASRALRAPTGAGKSPTWSAPMCARPRSRTA